MTCERCKDWEDEEIDEGFDIPQSPLLCTMIALFLVGIGVLLGIGMS